MRLLAVDTSTQACGVAVVDGQGLLSESLFASRQTHSRHLLSMIDETLARCGLTLSDMEGFAVTCGPGSFTGLRIGMSVVKALAETCGARIAGIPTLEALAFGARNCHVHVLPMLDARKGEVYSGLYASDGNGVAEVETPQAISPEGLLQKIAEPVLCIGSGASVYRETIVETLGDLAAFSSDHEVLRPSVVAELGLRCFASGEAVDPAGLVPIYLRKSDAEMALEKRMALEGHE
ncbi:MAG: tRNA (adenosine(37)-N6)-threonylcarbamoyltransferase complex dimerization subunit type 1 TsaB [Desulfobacterales bacterium]|nr:tRNA (adenosine(37)-N6)-threonylcarbamoyltransferase complex dimerization subunit type 1 TsaB [Desulfobacterales bacterium]